MFLVFQGFCDYGQHNRMADILFKTPEGGLHAMLHAPYGKTTGLNVEENAKVVYQGEADTLRRWGFELLWFSALLANGNKFPTSGSAHRWGWMNWDKD